MSGQKDAPRASHRNLIQIVPILDSFEPNYPGFVLNPHLSELTTHQHLLAISQLAEVLSQMPTEPS